MRLALHMGTLRGAGSGAVGRNVLAELARCGQDHRIRAWVPREWEHLPGLTPSALGRHVELSYTRAGLHRKVWLENVSLRRRLGDADVLFSVVDTSLPRCPVPHMLMVHQPYLAYAPSERGFRPPRRMALKMRLMERYLRLALPTVDRVTVQTRDMRDRIVARYGYPAERVVLVPSAVQPGAVAISDDVPRVEGPPFVAYVATPAAHKNHVVLASMLAELPPEHADVICRVTTTPEQVPALAAEARRLGVSSRIVYEGRVPAQRAGQLMRDAAAVVMPTKLESFGIPYYEAMAFGTGVVAADRAFAHEACGSAAEYADMDSGASFAAAFTRLLARDPDELAAQARARFEAVHRPWSEVARAYLDVLEELAGGAGLNS